MNDDLVGAGAPKGFQKYLRAGTHQVNIEKHFHLPSKCFHHIGPKRDVWNEVTVHHIQVQPVPTGAFGSFCLGGQFYEIPGQ